jgi:membrane associated rhomboid family serine protease
MRRPIKWLIAFIAWMIGSAAIFAFIRSFSKAAWADILGVVIFFVLGIVIAWIATKIKTYS